MGYVGVGCQVAVPRGDDDAARLLSVCDVAR
jgi:hypothetical protein